MKFSCQRTLATRKRLTICNLPFELLVDIFSRLSIPDISQSKLVCKDLHKNLLTMLTHPFFINLHSSLQYKENNPNILIFSVKSSTRHYTKLYLAIHGTTGLGASPNTRRICLDHLNMDENMEIVGSANGLIRLYNVKEVKFWVCNPLTEEISELPKASDIYPWKDHCGFAFDAINNTYKIVLMSRMTSSSKAEGMIYTLGSGVWRKLENLVSCFLEQQRPVTLNGDLHWVGKHCSSVYIVAMNVCTEAFEKIQGPSQYCVSCMLCLVSDCLSVITDITVVWEIWSLKNCSWERKSIVKKQAYGVYHHDLKVIGAMNNGRFLFKSKYYREFYHNKKNKFQEITVQGVPYSSDAIIDGFLHIGNLISPKLLA